MKKLISVLLVFVMLVPVFSMQSFAGLFDNVADFEKDGVYYYETDDNKVHAYGYVEQEEGSAPVELVIPETVKDGRKTYTVTGIEYSAFENSNYSKITLPDTITSIGGYAFYGSAMLEEVVIPENCEFSYFGTDVFKGTPAEGKFYENEVNKVGRNVLYSYTGSEKEFAIPAEVDILAAGCFMFSGVEAVEFHDGVSEIPPFAFSSCRNLKEIEIPAGIYMVGEAAFKDCVNLEKVKLGNGVEILELNCFAGTKISTINLPESIEIVAGAFNDCRYLAEITVDKNNDYFLSDENALYSKYEYEDWDTGETVTEKTLEYYYGANTAESYTVASDVASIGDYAFYNCKSLKTVYVPEIVYSIGEKAFANSSVETVEMSLVEGCIILDSAFANCKNLKNIDLTGVYYISTGAFQNCTSLVNVTLSPAVSYIGGMAFSNTGIENIEIYGESSLLDEGVFKGCQNLKDVVIGDGVYWVDAFVFQNCPKLETVYLSKTVEDFAENALIDCENVNFKVIKFSEGHELVEELGYNYEIVGELSFFERVSKFFSDLFESFLNWILGIQ